MQIPEIASCLLLCIALYTDLLWRKIPNYITMPAMVMGFWFYTMNPEPGMGTAFAFHGLLTGTGLLIIAFILGGAGGGDVKLFGALGALLGSYAVLSIFIYTAIIGGIISFCLLLKKRKLLAVKEIIYDVNLLFFSQGKRIATKKAGFIPYSVPTACGFAVYTFHGGLF